MGATAATAPMIQRQRRPAMKRTNAPDPRINNDVPRSGCFRIRTKGAKINARLTAVCFTPGGKLREDRYQAMVIGMMIRSEEHTSELQSLMRISYAVFCLKKTTIT